MDPIAPKQVELSPGVFLPASALRFQYARSPGPGGQNVNKLNTKATLTIAAAELEKVLEPAALERLRRLAGRQFTSDRLVLNSAASRSQVANRRTCLTKLRYLVVRALVRPKVRRPTRPSRSAVEQRLREKSHRSRIKQMRGSRPQTDDD